MTSLYEGVTKIESFCQRGIHLAVFLVHILKDAREKYLLLPPWGKVRKGAGGQCFQIFFKCVMCISGFRVIPTTSTLYFLTLFSEI